MTVYDEQFKFMIHLQGAVYANELYNQEDMHIYSLEEAIEWAEIQFGADGWEVYNGTDGCNRFRED